MKSLAVNSNKMYILCGAFLLTVDKNTLGQISNVTLEEGEWSQNIAAN